MWSHPLSLVLYTPGNGDTYVVKSVYYDNIEYNTIQELLDAYNGGTVRDIKAEDDDGYDGRFVQAECNIILAMNENLHKLLIVTS